MQPVLTGGEVVTFSLTLPKQRFNSLLEHNLTLLDSRFPIQLVQTAICYQAGPLKSPTTWASLVAISRRPPQGYACAAPNVF
jgi:hypothetical protein